MEVHQIFGASIETALNRYLSLDPQALQTFSPLEGKVIGIHITGLNITLSIFPGSDGFMVLSEFDGEADTTISGTPIALAKLGLADNPKDILFDGEIQVSGDTRLANQFSRLLAQVDIDWEEIAAQNIGDIAAHKLGNVLRGANKWLQRATSSVNLDMGEYLQEEARLSPSNAELRQFINRVDEAREAADRLAARIVILNDRHNSNNK